MEIVAYERAHLEPVLALAARAELASSLVADPERAHRALSAPGAVALVAVAAGVPLGFAHTITDGAFQAYLTLLAVAPEARRRGIGRALVEASVERCGAIRVDLISTAAAEPFYRGFRPGGRWPGYRLYPDGAPGATSDDG